MPAERRLRLGTRGSQLALWQAQAVADRVAAAGGPACQIVAITTSGDRPDVTVSPDGGKRLFVKEIEEALLRGEIDLAVHSAKDLSAELPRGVIVFAALPREDPRDALVFPLPPGHGGAPPGRVDSVDQAAARLTAGALIGTGSIRRVAQLSPLFRGARFAGVRGNIDTRLNKLDDGRYDALVLAAAGLRRLGRASRISLTLPSAVCVPAPGQGIVAVEIRDNDDEVRGVVAPVVDRRAGEALTAERSLIRALGGDCQTPLGALAAPLEAGGLELAAIVATLDGSRVIRAQGRGTDADRLGEEVAARLTAQGAADLLAEARSRHDTTRTG